jgi:hypothetical protein
MSRKPLTRSHPGGEWVPAGPPCRPTAGQSPGLDTSGGTGPPAGPPSGGPLLLRMGLRARLAARHGRLRPSACSCGCAGRAGRREEKAEDHAGRPSEVPQPRERAAGLRCPVAGRYLAPGSREGKGWTEGPSGTPSVAASRWRGCRRWLASARYSRRRGQRGCPPSRRVPHPCQARRTASRWSRRGPRRAAALNAGLAEPVLGWGRGRRAGVHPAPGHSVQAAPRPRWPPFRREPRRPSRSGHDAPPLAAVAAFLATGGPTQSLRDTRSCASARVADPPLGLPDPGQLVLGRLVRSWGRPR